MGDFSSGFGTGFEIGSIIKEKKRAKKAVEDMKVTLDEWRLSGKEPSYMDKLMMGLTATQAGQTYAKIFNDITGDKASYDKEKLSQDAMKLREYTNQIMNLTKTIQTAVKDGTSDLLPWETFKEVFPDYDIEEVLSNIPEMQKKRQEAQARKENIDIYGKTPTDVRQGVGEQLGVIPEGVEPAPEAQKEPTVANYNSAASYLSKFVNANPDTFNKVKAGLQSKTGIDLSAITQESLKKPEKAVATKAPKAVDPNDVLFGTNGIMKDYIGSGSRLGEEQKIEIRNNYEIIKPSLTGDIKIQVEDYLKQIGIDVSKAVPEPEVLLDIKKKPFWQSDWKYYQGLTVEELYQLADKNDDKKAYEELKKRGKIR